MRKKISQLLSDCAFELTNDVAVHAPENVYNFDVNYKNNTSLTVDSDGTLNIDDVQYSFSVNIKIQKV